MGYLLSKQFDIENIYYNELRNTRGYKLHYKLPYCILNGITFNIDIKQYLTTKKEYYVEPTEASMIFINKINEKLKNICDTVYSPILKNNSIYFRKNDITTKFLSNHKGSITLNIINMKKNAYHCYPIVYIV